MVVIERLLSMKMTLKHVIFMNRVIFNQSKYGLLNVARHPYKKRSELALARSLGYHQGDATSVASLQET